MKKNCTIFKLAKPAMKESFGEEKAETVLKGAVKRYIALQEENKNDPKAYKTHEETNAFPAIALYEELLKSGIKKDEAVDFLDRLYSKNAEGQAKFIRGVLKIPYLYRLFPKIYKSIAQNKFGEKAGFEAKYYDLGKERCKFDMTKCFYCEICKRYNCPEIIKCFCHTDDVTTGNIHPKLVWHRTQIMGDGAPFCDFDIYVDENKKLK